MAFIQKNNIVLHYQWHDNKQSKTIVLINSLGTNLSIWEQVVPLISSSLNVLVFDKRGHGLSSTSEGVLNIDTYADDVIFLMDALGIEQAYALGLSIGGLINYSLASRYPTRFERFIFSNTGAKVGTKEAWDNRIKAIKADGISGMSQNIIERWLSQSYRANNVAETAGYVNMLERSTKEGYIQACAAIAAADYNPIVDTIKHPTLFIAGSEDLGTSPAFVQTHAKNLGAACIVLDGVGHLPCIEVPALVAQVILEFCKEELSLYDLGMQTRRSVLGDAHVDRAEANKTGFDTDFQTYIINSAWGSIWSRPGLSKRERSMITIAVLAALGHEEELEMHMKATRNTGASIEDIKEVLLHIGIYAGVPVTNGAMKMAKKIFEKK